MAKPCVGVPLESGGETAVVADALAAAADVKRFDVQLLQPANRQPRHQRLLALGA